MNARKSLWRYLALVPAVLLVAGFIAFRAGAFQRVAKPDPQPMTEEEEQIFLGGSKSAPAFGPTSSAPPPKPDPPVFLGGSKSIALPGTTIGLTPAGANPGANQLPGTPPAVTKPPVFMGGSKSTEIVQPREPGAPVPP